MLVDSERRASGQDVTSMILVEQALLLQDGKLPTDLALDYGHQDIVAFFRTVNETISAQKIRKYEEFL